MSKASYESIDYHLRPAKTVERKMLADLFRRLDRGSAIRHYRYVGFGSPYFSDFSLFHRTLDIQSMISIEREEGDRLRFEYNRPFAAVELIFGESSQVLPDLDWTQRTILWLDYDDPLDAAMLNDIELAANSLVSGSVILVSCSCELPRQSEARLQAFRSNLEESAPISVGADDLIGWDAAAVYRRIIDERLTSSLTRRNAGKQKGLQVLYQQLVNFEYADGARMLTVGGIVLSASDENFFRQCAFDDFEFSRFDETAYRIQIPHLTPKEVRHLDTLLPSESGIDATDVGVPLRQSNRYEAIYRYFPRFTDVEA